MTTSPFEAEGVCNAGLVVKWCLGSLHVQPSSPVESSGESSAPSICAVAERRLEAPVPFVLLLF